MLKTCPLRRPPNPLNREIDEKISPFKTITSYQRWNCWKSVFWRPSQPPRVEIIENHSHHSKNQSFEGQHTSQSKNYPKSLLWRPPHHPKVQIIQNQSLNSHHILPRWKWSKISPFKTTTVSQNVNCPKEDHHTS